MAAPRTKRQHALRAHRPSPAPDDRVDEVNGRRLTRREQEILDLLAVGASAPDIASQLYLSTATVKTHLHNLYRKLDVSDRAAAVAEGMRRGLIR